VLDTFLFSLLTFDATDTSVTIKVVNVLIADNASVARLLTLLREAREVNKGCEQKYLAIGKDAILAALRPAAPIASR
jgi:hypothetical protein